MRLTKLIKYIIGMIFAACIMGNCTVAKAADEEKDVDESIVKIITAYVDENGNTYYVKQGTGFLVGVDSGDKGERYVLTDYGIVEGDPVALDTIRKRNGLAEDIRLEIKYYAMGSMGIMTELDINSYGKDTGYAVLEADEGMTDKVNLKLGDGEKVQVNGRVYVAGYAGNRSLLEQDGIADKHIIEYSTIITDVSAEEYYDEEIQYFTVGENIKEGMAGAPVIDDEGCVAGMFILKDGQLRAMSVKNIRIILEAIDVDYMVNGDVDTYDVPEPELKQELMDLVIENKAYLSSVDRYKFTEKTWVALYDAVNKGEEICQNISSTKKLYQDGIKDITTARKKLKTTYQKLIVWCVILGVVLVVMIVFLAKGIKKRKLLRVERESM